MEDFDAEFVEYLAEELGAHREGFTVETDDHAEWCLDVLAQAAQRKAARAQHHQRRLEQRERWKARRDAEDDRTIERMTSFLRAYYDRLTATGKLGSRKSYPLPNGTLTSRHVGPKFDHDDDVLLQIVRPLGFVRTKEEPDWAEIKKRLVLPDDPLAPPLLEVGINEETGEVLRIPCPGVRVTSLPGEVFQVKLPDVEV